MFKKCEPNGKKEKKEIALLLDPILPSVAFPGRLWTPTLGCPLFEPQTALQREWKRLYHVVFDLGSNTAHAIPCGLTTGTARRKG